MKKKAAGLVVVAHDSGGPKMDIVVDETVGFRASTPKEYALCLMQALQMTPETRHSMIHRARQHVKQFSDEKFDQRFGGIIERML